MISSAEIEIEILESSCTADMWNIKGLLTECEVCMGKYFPEIYVQTERRRNQGPCEKTDTFPYRPSKRG